MLVCNTTRLKQKSEDGQFTYLYNESCGLSAQIRPLSCEQFHHENQGMGQATNNRLINLQFPSPPTYHFNFPYRHHWIVKSQWLATSSEWVWLPKSINCAPSPPQIADHIFIINLSSHIIDGDATQTWACWMLTRATWLLVFEMNNLTRSQRLHWLLQKHWFQTLEWCRYMLWSQCSLIS